MEAPSLNETLVTRIREQRPSFELRWNPTSRLRTGGSIDATGTVRQPEYEGRYELWDKTPDSPPYQVLTCQWPDGSYRHPDDWLVELLERINPARFDGSVHKLLHQLVDQQEELREKVLDDDWDDFCEMVAKWATYAAAPKTRVSSFN